MAEEAQKDQRVFAKQDGKGHLLRECGQRQAEAVFGAKRRASELSSQVVKSS